MSDERPGERRTETADALLSDATGDRRRGLVVCSLEPWTEVRRRLRIVVDEMVGADPSLEVLFVAPAVDLLHVLRTSLGALAHQWRTPRLEQVHPRVRVLRPRKWAPRRLGAFVQRGLERQVLRAVTHLGLRRPVLWVNDALYAPLVVRTGWPSVYDVTDDWLLSDLDPRQRARLAAADATLLERADAVVVCSPELARTRGATRPVDLIGNGVDLDLFRAPQPRPADLPEAPVALYVGTLQDERIDVELLVQIAVERPDIHYVLIGPNCLSAAANARLQARPNVRVHGPVPYPAVPAYLQHADVVIVPHQVDAFTESLDPIKAYECLAVGRPTVATPVAGFRDLGPPVRTADAARFGEAVGRALADGPSPGTPVPLARSVPTWRDRAQMMGAVIERVREGADHPGEEVRA